MKIVRHNIGDEVIALNSPRSENSQPRVKGQKYVVKDTMYCCRCGIQSINIGYKSPDVTRDEVLCGCGSQQLNYGLMWTDSKYFANVQDIEASMEEALEEEDYELATILRDANISLEEKKLHHD